MQRLVATIFILIALASAASAGKRQLTALPGSVVRGERVLSSSGCLDCHALKGKGGNRGPDLAMPSRTAQTPALFAASFWNHIPAMLAEFTASNKQPPDLKPTDAADLFSYFYGTLYFSPRGSASRGGSVFVEKGCANCHSEVLNTQPRDPLKESWRDLKDPSTWAERMWNHATEMDTATSNRGMRWPTLSDQDVADLLVFLSSRAGTESATYSLTMGEPELGKAVFEESCTSCHSLGRQERSKVDLLSRKGPSSVTGYVASMWNHVPAMRRQKGSTPKLKSGQMPDLIAFLFAQRYFFDPGDPGRGKKVFSDKSCSTCHQDRRLATGAPDLSKAVETFSPITLTAAGLRHGVSMTRTMRQMGIEWPEFKDREMADLIAYLNSIRIVRIASVKNVH